MLPSHNVRLDYMLSKRQILCDVLQPIYGMAVGQIVDTMLLSPGINDPYFWELMEEYGSASDDMKAGRISIEDPGQAKVPKLFKLSIQGKRDFAKYLRDSKVRDVVISYKIEHPMASQVGPEKQRLEARGGKVYFTRPFNAGDASRPGAVEIGALVPQELLDELYSDRRCERDRIVIQDITAAASDADLDRWAKEAQEVAAEKHRWKRDPDNPFWTPPVPGSTSGKERSTKNEQTPEVVIKQPAVIAKEKELQDHQEQCESIEKEMARFQTYLASAIKRAAQVASEQEQDAEPGPGRARGPGRGPGPVPIPVPGPVPGQGPGQGPVPEYRDHSAEKRHACEARIARLVQDLQASQAAVARCQVELSQLAETESRTPHGPTEQGQPSEPVVVPVQASGSRPEPALRAATPASPNTVPQDAQSQEDQPRGRSGSEGGATISHDRGLNRQRRPTEPFPEYIDPMESHATGSSASSRPTGTKGEEKVIEEGPNSISDVENNRPVSPTTKPVRVLAGTETASSSQKVSTVTPRETIFRANGEADHEWDTVPDGESDTDSTDWDGKSSPATPSQRLNDLDTNWTSRYGRATVKTDMLSAATGPFAIDVRERFHGLGKINNATGLMHDVGGRRSPTEGISFSRLASQVGVAVASVAGGLCYFVSGKSSSG